MATHTKLMPRANKYVTMATEINSIMLHACDRGFQQVKRRHLY